MKIAMAAAADITVMIESTAMETATHATTTTPALLSAMAALTDMRTVIVAKAMIATTRTGSMGTIEATERDIMIEGTSEDRAQRDDIKEARDMNKEVRAVVTRQIAKEGRRVNFHPPGRVPLLTRQSILLRSIAALGRTLTRDTVLRTQGWCEPVAFVLTFSLREVMKRDYKKNNPLFNCTGRCR